jgi:hypothetical protein
VVRSEGKVSASLHWTISHFGEDRHVGLPTRFATPLTGVHDVFHMSYLRRYVPSDSHILEIEPLHIKRDLTYHDRPLRILDTKGAQLRRCMMRDILIQ